MRKQKRNLLISLCGAVATLGLVAGVWAGIPNVNVDAATAAPTVTMVPGASTRKDENNPGIKFTAKVGNYDPSYKYGMLILPEGAWSKFGWTNQTDYVSELEEMEVEYANIPCGVYLATDANGDRIEGDYEIAGSLKNINVANYAESFVGVAYTYKNGVYEYADVDMVENARSIAYVAQMALKYEDGLTARQKAALKSYATPGIIIEEENYEPTEDMMGGVTTIDGEYAMKYIFNAAGETVSQVTKKGYAGGSTVSFRYYIPAGTVTSWWGIAWHTDPNQANIYHAAGAENPVGYHALGSTTGAWTDVSFTLPAGGPYYLYFGSEVGASNGRWMLDGANSYALIDNFKVGNEIEKFSTNISDWAFEVISNAGVQVEELKESSFGFVSENKPKELSAKLIIDKFNSAGGSPASFITKNKYAAGSKISFKYYLPTDVTSTWFAVCGVDDPSNTNIYENWLWQGNLEKGSWKTMTITLEKDCYIHFAGAVGDWGGKDTPKTEGYVLIDDFTINGVTENFNLGVDESIFNVNTIGAVVNGEGFIAPSVQEMAMKFVFNATDELSVITKDAYAGGSTVSFKYYIPEGTDVGGGWWGIAWNTVSANANNYHTAGIEANYIGHEALSKTIGVWTDVSFTLPAGGPYYLYFGSNIGSNSWKLGDGSNSYALIDEFTVGETKETFNNGMAESIFTVKKPSKVMDSAIGEGYVEVENDDNITDEKLGDLAMKYIFNVSGEKVSQVTKKAYAGGSAVSFKYYIPTGTATQWWGLVWSTGNTGLDIYAAADANKAHAITGSNTVTGVWTDVSFTLPAGGPYYLYFGSEVGHWKVNGEDSYVLIDEFTVGEETETFDYGMANSAFNILVSGAVVNSEDGEGWTPLYGAYGAKIYGDKISSTKTTPTFITKQAYTFTEPTIVTFDYYMSGNTKNKWWTFAWTTDRRTASIYAHVENNKENNNAKDLPTNVQNAWASASVEVPAGTWYFYFATAKGEWSGGHVIIDNLKLGDQVTETFNYGISDSIFDVSPYSSHHAAIELADGMEDFMPGEYSAKLDFTQSFDNNANVFITKEAYDGGSTISFRYMIPEETTVGDWWAFCWTNDLSNGQNFWAVGEGAASTTYGGVNPNPNKHKGQGWVEYSVTLPAGGPYYLYFCGYNNWNGCVYIDEFTVKTGLNIVKETFTNGYKESMFNVGNSAYVTLGEGYVAEEVEIFEEGDTSLAALIANKTIINHLNEDAESYIFNKEVAIQSEVHELMSTMLLLEASFKFIPTGTIEFAVYFGNSYYLYISPSSAALYKDFDKLVDLAAKPVADNENIFNVSITGNGKLLVKIGNNAYEGLGQMISIPTCFKLVALGGEGSVMFDDIKVTIYSVLENSEGAPIYFSNDTIDITAYAFDSDVMVSEVGFQLLAEAGFTKTLALLQGRVDNLDYENPSQAEVDRLMMQVNADAMAALELAEKYGLKHYVFNEPFYNLERQTEWYDWVDEIHDLASYTLSNAFAGHFLADEPEPGWVNSELKELVKAYKAYKQAFPEGEAFINLLPSSSSKFAVNSYSDYVDYYIENIALDKDGVPGTGYVSFDEYPLRDGEISSTHLRNLEIVAEKCRDNNIELRTYIKASTSGDSERYIRATESKNDLMFQIYSALAYGSKEIIYYQFTDHTIKDNSAGDGVINGSTLQKGDVYNWAKEVNHEVLNLSSAYMNFTWKSASVFGKTSITQFNNLKSKASAYGVLSNVTATESSTSILVGNFDDADGKMSGEFDAYYGYMVVNYGDPDGGASKTNVTVTFDAAKADWALIYRAGKTLLVELDSGKLTLADFEEGEGAFIIPILYK